MENITNVTTHKHQFAHGSMGGTYYVFSKSLRVGRFPGFDFDKIIRWLVEYERAGEISTF